MTGPDQRAQQAPHILRRLAALLIRGSEAPYVQTDLDDAFDREVARGMTRAQATWRYFVNTCLSAVQLSVSRFRRSSFSLSSIDVRLGLRMLVKYPTLTFVSVFALAIALPVCLAPLHMARAVESHLPEDPEGRLQLLRLVNGSTNVNDLERWSTSLGSFDRIAGLRQSSFNFELDAGVLPVAGAEVSASIFPMLAVAPALGRTFADGDEAAGAAPVVVIGDRLWRTAFAEQRDLTSLYVRIAGQPHHVVGVMPDGFYFPSREQAWLPLRDQSASSRKESRGVRIIGHLADRVSADNAQTEFTAVAMAGVPLEPGDERLVPEVVPTSFMMFNFPKGGFRATPDFYIAQVLTVVPLLIACFNVGLLIFARSATRSSEFAIRAALGASRSRILTQVFTESFVLVMLATGAGLGLLHWLPERALTMVGVALPYWIDTGLTMPIVAGALLLGAVAAGIAGVIPVLRTTGRSVQRALQRTRRSGAETRFGGFSTFLIVADVAAAVAVIGVAMAIGRQVDKTIANTSNDGITAERYLSFSLQATSLHDPSGAAKATPYIQQTLIERLKAEPGVRAVAVGSVLPRMEHPTSRIELADGEVRTGTARTASVDRDFFTELRHPIISGRGFNATDLSLSANSAIVNTSFVTNILGGANPIGRRVRLMPWNASAEPGPWLEIVGVVGHLGMRSINAEFDTGIYQVLRPGSLPHVKVAIELTGDPMEFVPRLRDIAWSVDSQAVVSAFTPLNKVFEGDWYIMAAAVAGGLLLVGVLLTLAASAIYAIMSFTVAQRTREIGVRIALGADRGRIVWQVARRALIQIGVGVAIGTLLTGTIMFEMLREDSPSVSPRLAVVLSLLPGVAILTLVALVSCAAPTLRALRISPVEALRNEGG